MKKLGRSTILALVALLLIVTPALAGRGPYEANAQATVTGCEELRLWGSFKKTSIFSRYLRIELWLDGEFITSREGYGKYIQAFINNVSVPDSIHSHTLVVKGFVRRKPWNSWLPKATATHRNIRVESCYVMCSEVDDPVYGEWTDWRLECDPSICYWLRDRDVEYFDAHNPERLCYNEPETEIKDAIPGCMDEEAENYNPDAEYDDGSCEYYQVCDVISDPVYSEWTEWFLEDSIWMRHRYVEYFDSRDPERQCDLQTEFETRDAIFGCTDPGAMNFDPIAEIDDGSCTYPKPVCPLQLLRNFNPPEGWLSYCMVLTEGAVSVGRQPAICGAGVVEWIADNQSCGGMVYDDGTRYGQWGCDRYGYYRQPISVLKCLWQRHLNGQRDQVSFDKCHGR